MDPPPKKKHTVHQKIQISQLWNLIETWGFCEDLKPVVLPVSDIPSDPPKHPSYILYPTSPKSTTCNNKSSNFSALELDRNLGFSRGPSHIGRPVTAIEHSFLFKIIFQPFFQTIKFSNIQKNYRKKICNKIFVLLIFKLQ